LIRQIDASNASVPRIFWKDLKNYRASQSWQMLGRQFVHH
jgi:hypothetical protein